MAFAIASGVKPEQGIANVVSPLLGGFAATGAIARTATNFRNGATSPLAGVVHALTLVVILLALAPLAAKVPLCSLAAILFVVAWNMSDARHVVHGPQGAAPRRIRSPHDAVADRVHGPGGRGQRRCDPRDAAVPASHGGRGGSPARGRSGAACGGQGQRARSLPPGVLVYSIEGPFFFRAVETLERAFQRTASDPRCIVIRLGNVPFMDITGLLALEEAVQNLERRGVRVLLCEARPNVLRKLVRAHIARDEAGQRRYVADLQSAVRACEAGAG